MMIQTTIKNQDQQVPTASLQDVVVMEVVVVRGVRFLLLMLRKRTECSDTN
jgi:hypothetical protein